MKRRNLQPKLSRKKAETGLCEALLALDSLEAMRAFLRDLCTPAELEALVDRWSVVPLVIEGHTYRDIHARTAVSITTIGRVARCITQGSGGYLAAATARSAMRGEAGKDVRA